MIPTDIRLVALDLDGTLLDDHKKIPDQTVETIQQVVQLGIHVTLASARPLCSILPYARQLNIQIPVIAHGGAYVTDVNEKNVKLKHTMDAAKSRELINMFQEHDYYIKVYCGDTLYVQEVTEETLEYSRIFGVPHKAVGRKQLTALNETPLRIVLFDVPQRINHARTLLEPWQSDFSLSLDADTRLEIAAGPVNKGAAVRTICNELGISMANVMAIGNEGNDIEMIRAAGLGIAMGNACDELKQYAADITKANTDLGVQYALKKYILQR